jgi:hypothetical protein
MITSALDLANSKSNVRILSARPASPFGDVALIRPDGCTPTHFGNHSTRVAFFIELDTYNCSFSHI